MSIRTANAGALRVPGHLTRGHLWRIAGQAANDNDDPARQDQVVRDALKHFASYGLKAAEDAGLKARAAHQRGDAQDLRHWLQICAALDPRRAAAMHRKLANLQR